MQVRNELNAQEQGYFRVYDDGNEAGEMYVARKGDSLVVLHTEIKPEYEGKGYATALFKNLIDYAREHKLQVDPLCPYVTAQLKRRASEYADVWKAGE